MYPLSLVIYLSHFFIFWFMYRHMSKTTIFSSFFLILMPYHYLFSWYFNKYRNYLLFVSQQDSTDVAPDRTLELLKQLELLPITLRHHFFPSLVCFIIIAINNIYVTRNVLLLQYFYFSFSSNFWESVWDDFIYTQLEIDTSQWNGLRLCFESY